VSKGKKRWVIPAATGFLGLVLGSGMGGSDTATTTPLNAATMTQTATVTEASTVTVSAEASTVTVTPKIQKAVDVPTSTSAKKTTKAKPTTEDEPADAYYANCSAARAAGAAPIHAGEPGYRAGLDRDGDGVACE
jgi:hypothetical protein